MATPNRAITSLDIRPEKLGELTAALEQDLKNLHRQLGNPDDINQPALEKIILQIMKHVPGDLTRDFDKELIGEIKTDIARVLTEYAQHVKGRTPNESDIGMLVDALILSLMKHQGVALAAKNVLDTNPAILDPKYQPLIKGGHISVIGHRMMTLLTWAGSFITTNEYIREHIDKFGVHLKIDNELAKSLKKYASPAIAATFSQLVRVIKDETEKIALHEKVPGIKGFFRAIGRPFTKKPDATDVVASDAIVKANRRMGLMMGSAAGVWVAGKIIVVLLDAFSNLTGYATTQLKSEVVSEAVEKGKHDIAARSDAIRQKIAALHADEIAPADLSAAPTSTDVPTVKFGKLVEKDIADEIGGTGVTQAKGAFSMAHAKMYMYQDKPVSRAYLEMNAAAIMKDAEDRGKPTTLARATEQVKLRTEFLAAIDESGVASNSVSLPGEISATMEAKFTKVDHLLNDISKLMGSGHLNPESDQGDLEKEFKVMTDKIQEISVILNKELPKDVNTDLARYNALNQRLAEIASRFPKVYPNYKASHMEPWMLGEIKIDASKICIPRPPSVDETNLLAFMKKNWGTDIPRTLKNPEGGKSLASWTVAGNLLKYILISMMISYGDLLMFLYFSRKAYNKDSAEAEKKRDEWIKNYHDKMVNILTRQLNSGMFGSHFNDAGEIATQTVEKALDDRVKELTTATLVGPPTIWGKMKAPWRIGRESKFFKVLTRIVPFSAPADYAGYTEEAQRHNAEVKAYLQILGSADEMGQLLQKILPGLRLVVEPRPGDSHQDVLNINRGVTVERRDTMQIDTINAARRQIGTIQSATDASTSAADWEKQWALLSEQEQVLNKINPQISEDNRETYNEVVTELHEVQRELERVLAQIVERENLTATVSSSDSDESLLARKSMLERLETLLEKLDTSKNFDFAATVNAALRGITVAIREIDTAREEKRLDAAVAGRQEGLRDVFEAAERDVTRLKKWSLGNKESDTDAVRAENLATLLGHRLAVRALKPGEKMPKDVADDLEAKARVILENLGQIYHAYPDRQREMQKLADEFVPAQAKLKTFYPVPEETL
ncbi:MAG: hypothetical protein NTX63_05555 [Candidatus Peregrinibacteria bacterium]|nr:hypothetical protein [Candidatus Peregrinibacteria bacterium]